MKTLFLNLALLLLSPLAIAQNPAALPVPAAEAAAIQAVVTKVVTNYRDHKFQDMAGYATEDVSWVNIVGMWWRGRPQVQEAHQAIFDRIFTGVKFTPGPPTIRLVTPDVAVVNLYCGVGAFYPPDGVNRGTNKMGDNQDLLTLVLVKQRGSWLLTAGQNTQVDARAAANDPEKPAKK